MRSLLLFLMSAPLLFGWAFFLLGPWLRERDLSQYEGRLEAALLESPREGVPVYLRAVGQSRFTHFSNLKWSDHGLTFRDLGPLHVVEYQKVTKLVLRKVSFWAYLEIHADGARYDLQSEFLVDIGLLVAHRRGLPFDRSAFYDPRWSSRVEVGEQGDVHADT